MEVVAARYRNVVAGCVGVVTRCAVVAAFGGGAASDDVVEGFAAYGRDAGRRYFVVDDVTHVVYPLWLGVVRAVVGPVVVAVRVRVAF